MRYVCVAHGAHAAVLGLHDVPGPVPDAGGALLGLGGAPEVQAVRGRVREYGRVDRGQSSFPVYNRS